MTEESEDKGDNNDKRIVENEAATEIGATIKDVERFVSIFVLIVLQAVINEQVRSKQLKRGVGDYIYQAVKDQVIRKGWIDGRMDKGLNIRIEYCVIALSNLMTDESRKVYRTKTKNPGSIVWELEGTIKLKYRTIEALKELSRHNNDEVYDQIIMRLVRSYSENARKI